MCAYVWACVCECVHVCVCVCMYVCACVSAHVWVKGARAKLVVIVNSGSFKNMSCFEMMHNDCVWDSHTTGLTGSIIMNSRHG